MEGRNEAGNRSLKILRIIPFLDFGGVEQRVRLTAMAMHRFPDIQMDIVVMGHGGQVSEQLDKNGTPAMILDQKVKIPNLGLVKILYALMKTLRPDVVHCSGAEANFHGLIAAQLAGVPVKIGEEIGFPNHHLLWRLVFKGVYVCADRVIGISRSVAEKVVALKEVPRSKVRVVYNPVEIECEKDDVPEISERDCFTFVTVCRLVPVKNLEGLLKAFAQLTVQVGPDNVRLQVVGEGPEKEALIRQCERLGISSQVRLLGYRGNVIPYLKQADAFVLPSFSEGFSIALVEAMLCGLPCIVTRIGGPSEIIKDGKTGYLIDPYQSEQLFEAMEVVYHTPKEEGIAMGNRARKYAEQSFSVDKYIEGLLRVYEEKRKG